MKPLVVIDADVLGRRRTGDETYIAALLGELAPLADQERQRALASQYYYGDRQPAPQPPPAPWGYYRPYDYPR